MRTHVVFHRIDLDGQASAAIVKLGLKRQGIHNVNCVPWNFDDPIPWATFGQGETVYVVDLTLIEKGYDDFRLMKQLAARGPVVWIDHHATAIEAAKQANWHCPGLLRVGAAACELVWEYFFPNQPLPMSIHHIGRQDVWDHSDPNTVDFNSGLKLYDTRPWLPIWEHIIGNHDFQQRVLQEGAIVHQYELKLHERYARAYAFDTTIAGLPAIAINLGLCNSSVFAAVYKPDRHRVMITFARSRKNWKVSLYTTHDDVDCGALAMTYGGGGHQKAGGFYCQDLPFPLT